MAFILTGPSLSRAPLGMGVRLFGAGLGLLGVGGSGGGAGASRDGGGVLRVR